MFALFVSCLPQEGAVAHVCMSRTLEALWKTAGLLSNLFEVSHIRMWLLFKKSLCRCWVFLFFFPYMYGSERQIHKLHGILWLLWSSGVRRDLHTNVTFDLNASSSTIFRCLLVFWLGNTKCDLSVMLFLPVELFSCYVERKRNQGVKKWRKIYGNNFLCLTTGRISRINQIQLTVTRQFQHD